MSLLLRELPNCVENLQLDQVCRLITTISLVLWNVAPSLKGHQRFGKVESPLHPIGAI